jgi:hypothetical protein
VNLPILSSNSSLGAGFIPSSMSRLVINSSSANPTFALNEVQNSYFVASWVSGTESESYAFQISSIDDNNGKNSTTLVNMAGGSNIVLSEVGATGAKDVGNMRFTLRAANDKNKVATIQVSSTTGVVYGNRLVTRGGLTMVLPSVTSGNNLSSVIHFIEADENGNVGMGKVFSATAGFTSNNDVTISSLGKANFSGANNFETYVGSKDYVGYLESPLATRTVYHAGGDQDYLDVEYHQSQAYADVFISLE